MQRRMALLAALAAFVPGFAEAGSDSESMTVTATVLESCSITANDLEFDDYDPVTATPMDGATTISVTCTNGTDYDVGIDAGLGTGATMSARRMTKSGGATLTYSLYTNSARDDVWGNTDGVDTWEGTGTGAAQSIDVYGRIPINQTAPAGDYEDTVTVEVRF